MSNHFVVRILRRLGHPEEAEEFAELQHLYGRRTRLRNSLRWVRDTATKVAVKTELSTVESAIKALEEKLAGAP